MKLPQHIMHWDDERGDGHSLIVTLAHGFCFGDEGDHVRGFDTIQEARFETAKKRLSPCHCDECAKGKMKQQSGTS